MTWAAWVTLAATVVNAIAVVVLVQVTRSYAKSSHRQAEAAEMQAGASEAAAKAAVAQANASQAQARAATATLLALRQQMLDEDAVAHNIVELGIKSALSHVEFWQQQIAGSFGLMVQSDRLPTPITLIPSNSAQVSDSAGRLSRELAATLGGAFDELTRVRQKIDGLSRVNDRGQSYVDAAKEARELGEMLSHAKANLQKCQTDLYGIPKKAPTPTIPL